MSVTYSEFVSIVPMILHSKPMRHTLLSSMAIFCKLSHKWYYYREEINEYKIVF